VNWKQEPVLFIDTETTGPDPDTARVVEIALALMFEGEVSWACTWIVNPGVPIPAGASNVHKIYDEDVKDAPPFDEILDMVALAMDHRICGAYNAPYDRTVLEHEFDLCETSLPEEFWADPMILARNFVSIRGKGIFQLTNLCSRLGIDLGEAAHTAAADAIAAGKILWYYASKLPDDLDEFAVLQTKWAKAQRAEWVRYCKRAGRDPGKDRI